MESRFVRIRGRVGAGITLAFLYVPLVIVIVYAFNKSVSGSWPPQLFTLKWFSVAWQDPTLKGALRTSVIAAICATCIALVLGSLASFAVHQVRVLRAKCWCRSSWSCRSRCPASSLPLPCRPPCSRARRSRSPSASPRSSSGHATFCVVVVYNNVVARLAPDRGLAHRSIDGPRRRRLDDVPAS